MKTKFKRILSMVLIFCVLLSTVSPYYVNASNTTTTNSREKNLYSKIEEDTRRVEDSRREEDSRRVGDTKREEDSRRVEGSRRVEDTKREEDSRRVEGSRRVEDSKRVDNSKRVNGSKIEETLKTADDLMMKKEDDLTLKKVDDLDDTINEETNLETNAETINEGSGLDYLKDTESIELELDKSMVEESQGIEESEERLDTFIFEENLEELQYVGSDTAYKNNSSNAFNVATGTLVVKRAGEMTRYLGKGSGLKYVETDEVNPDLYGKYRMVYCLDQNKDTPDGETNWNGSGALKKELIYVMTYGVRYWGETSVDTKYTTGDWKKDYYGTQMALHVLNNEFPLSALNTGSNMDVYNLVALLVNDASNPANYGGFKENQYRDIQYKITPTSTDEWYEYDGGYATNWFYQTISDGCGERPEWLKNSSFTLEGAPEGVYVYKQKDNPVANAPFYVYATKAAYQQMKKKNITFKVKVQGQLPDYLSGWKYQPVNPNWQPVTLFEMSWLPQAVIGEITLGVKPIGNLTIQKKDDHNGSLLEGATFQLDEWSDKNNRWQLSSDHLIWNAVTRTYHCEGLETTKDNLGRFKVKEIKAPETYSGSWEQEFDLTSGTTDLFYEVQNKQGWIDIILEKNDRNTNTNHFQGDASLEGAVYGLYADQDFKHPDGTKEYKKDELIEIKVTDSLGRISFSRFYPIKLYLKEITPPKGYLLDMTTYSIDPNITTEVVITKNIIVTEQVMKQAIQLIKISSNGSSEEVELLEGAGFTPYLISELSKVKDGTFKPEKKGAFTTDDFLQYQTLYGFENEPVARIDGVTCPELFTDKKGYLKTPEFPYGLYVMVETTTPQDYETTKPFIFEIDHDKREPQVWRIFNDAPAKFRIKIVKKDFETGKEVLNNNMWFRIFNEDTKEYVTMWDKTPLPTKFGTEKNPFKTNNEGYAILPEMLGVGHYVLEEVKAPIGYVIQGKEGELKPEYETNPDYHKRPSEKVQFVVDGNTAILIDQTIEEPAFIVEQKNQQQKGKILIDKVGERMDSFVQDKSVYGNFHFNYSLKPLEHVKFNIVAAEDILSLDGHQDIVYKKEEVIEHIITDKVGHAYSSIPLPIGKYYLEEIETLEGFVKQENIYFEITADHQDIAFNYEQIKVENHRQLHNVEVIKKDKETGDLLEGAEFTLTLTEDMKVGAEIILAGTPIKVAISDETGKAVFEDLPNGSYLLTETKAPDGYFINQEFEETVIIKADDSQDSPKIYRYTCENEYITLELSKESVTDGKHVEGAEIELYRIFQNERELVEKYTTGKEPKVFKYLSAGQYVMKETIAPFGFAVANEISFDLLETKEVQKHKMIDQYDQHEIEIIKQDDETGKPLQGAEFMIINSDDIIINGQLIYKSGEISHIFQTDENGKAVQKGILSGTYQIKEIKAPEGYFINDSFAQEVRLGYDNQKAQSLTLTCFNTKINHKILLSKVDESNNLPLEGAEFTLKANVDIYVENIREEHVDKESVEEEVLLYKKGDIIQVSVTDKKGMVEFINLQKGSYELIETKPPKGYELNKESSTIIELGKKDQDQNKNEEFKVKVTNRKEGDLALIPEPRDAVKTGDNTRIGIFLTMFISAGVMAFLIKKIKRNTVLKLLGIK